MKITNVTVQARNPDRVNVSIDGKYKFSLYITQVTDLGIKRGQEIDEAQLAEYLRESEFGKLYARTLEYTLMRPRSIREVRDYLYRKTLASKYKTKKGDIKEREGVSQSVTERVFVRLSEKNYINDESFARWWVENRNQRKGTSQRKLRSELLAKGVSMPIIDQMLSESERNDEDELQKIIAKKRKRYPDNDKMMAYLSRQGFSYDDIKSALDTDSD